MSHITKSINKMPASIHKHQSTNTLQFPVITPETLLMMSNLQQGCRKYVAGHEWPIFADYVHIINVS